ncbi:cuticle protein 64-like [Culex quinquefasciatus]|uniref:cuticle protein 64-like n=1 Tax=Culex quinquefasciatus TaxID=7176 RepID=UPI0018E2F8FD|nr:cuticle protein 64-like [Culex quinquefasciatus]
MAFKLAVIFATLAYVSAGAVDTGVHHQAGVPAAVSYQYRSQVVNPSVPYATGHSQGHAVLTNQVTAVPAPITKTFAVPAVPTVAHGVNHGPAHGNNYGYSGYGHGYVPALAYGNNYGYAGYGVAPVVNYGHYAAGPVLATGAYGYTPAGHLGYDKYGHHAY